MTSYALAAIGRDRPGIVAAISRVLYEQGCNVTDSSMTMLRGNFAVMLVFDATGAELADLTEALEPTCRDIGLYFSVLEVADLPEHTAPTHILTVYGADRPGILFRTSAELAEAGVNITDLNSRLVGGVYALMLELSLSIDAAALEARLRPIATEVGVDLTLRELDDDIL